MRLLHLLAVVLVLALGVTPQASRAQGVGPDLPGTGLAALIPDYAAWQRVAQRAERVSESGQASTFALQRLRLELANWRDTFQKAQSINAARISTVRQQISALGAAPDTGGVEAPEITARRSELEAELARLRAPALLAVEAHAAASGLISEIDALVLSRRTETMLTRGPSPLNPANWPEAGGLLLSGLDAIYDETAAGIAVDRKAGVFAANARLAAFFALVSIGLLWRGRYWARAVQRRVAAANPRGTDVWIFLLSLFQLAIPLLGVLLLVQASKTADFLGYRGLELVKTLSESLLFLIVARWLSGHFFEGQDGRKLPISFTPDERRQGRVIMLGLGWTLLISAMVLTVSGVDASQTATAMLSVPAYVLIGVFLFWLGRLFVLHGANPAEGNVLNRDKALTVIGRICQLLAVAGPVLAALGYSSAAESALFPAVTTLALLAVVVLLQRFVADVYVLMVGGPNEAGDGLVPVLLGLALLVLSLPLFSLIWGASTTDLADLWTRFHEGFTIGGTRISPTSFLTFALVFAGGYMITRLVQNTLRTAVLTKTKIDIGGQNAITSGLGYVGVFLAALLAITAAGIDLSSLAIVAGALSVGIGFGLQNIVSNFVSGIILLIERPIGEGDWIEVGGQMGYVRDISVRSTRIETFDRTDVIIPNADLVSGQVTNWTRGNLVGRVIVPVGVAYGTDTMRVDRILREIAEAHPMVLLTPPPTVAFMGFGADSLNFEIRVILRDVNFSLSVRTELNHAIAARLKEEGIEIPFAQRDIWLRNPEVLQQTPPLAAASKSATTADGTPAAPPAAAKPVLKEED